MQQEMAALESSKAEKSVFAKNELGESLCPEHKGKVLTEITVEGGDTLYACDSGETYDERGQIRPRE